MCNVMNVYLVVLFFINIFLCGYANKYSESTCSGFCQTSCDTVQSSEANFSQKCIEIQKDCNCFKPRLNKPDYGSPIYPITIFSSLGAFMFLLCLGTYIRHKFWRRNSQSEGTRCGFDCSRANWSRSSSTAPVMHAPITAHPVTTVSPRFNTQYSNYS